MHRQSLGSPLSKAVKDEQVCYEPHKQTSEEEEEGEEVKKVKGRSGGMPETYIHLIPMLTLLCFLILYLSSHDPSLNDLPQFNTFFNPADSISELQQVGDIKKGDILAIRSLKNLPDVAKHRKFARQKLV